MLKLFSNTLVIAGSCSSKNRQGEYTCRIWVSHIVVRITYHLGCFDFIMGVYDNSTETENVTEDGGYIKVTNNLEIT